MSQFSANYLIKSANKTKIAESFFCDTKCVKKNVTDWVRGCHALNGMGWPYIYLLCECKVNAMHSAFERKLLLSAK